MEDLAGWPFNLTSKARVAAPLRTTWQTVGNLVRRLVGDHLDDDSLEDLYRIEIDETAYHKGRKFLTVVTDHDTGRVVHLAKRAHQRRPGWLLPGSRTQRRALIRAVSVASVITVVMLGQRAAVADAGDVPAEDVIYLMVDALLCVRGGGRAGERRTSGRRRSFLPRQQEDQDLVPDVLSGQRSPCLRVARRGSGHLRPYRRARYRRARNKVESARSGGDEFLDRAGDVLVWHFTADLGGPAHALGRVECIDHEVGRGRTAVLVALVCDAEAMLRTTIYRRSTADGVESLKVVASIDRDGDSEIRVSHIIDESVVDDRIGFHGHGGEQWLRDRHTSWTADGFQLVSSGPEF